MDDKTDSDEYVCEACEKVFESEEALERHVHDIGLVD
ncbi:MAG: C2H2-type zinc finger protein [Natronomonas sp.]